MSKGSKSGSSSLHTSTNKIKRRNLKPIVASVFAIPLASFAVSQRASGTTLFWSGNGTSEGGAGTWNTSVAHWGTTSGGPFATIWNNANVDSAVFESSNGAVSLGGTITANQITFNTATYSIGNGNGVTTNNTINFSGADAGYIINHTSGTTTNTALLLGTVTKQGVGRLETNNSSQAGTVKWVLKGGALTAAAPSRLGTPASFVQDFFTFDGGGFGGNTTTAYDLGTNRGVTINAGGAFFGATGNTIIITIGGKITGSAGGDLNVGGTPFVNSAHTSGGVIVLSNTANDFNGNINLNAAGALRLGASNVVPDTAAVNLLISGSTFDLNTNTANETIRTISGTAGTVAIGNATLTLNAPANETYSSVLTGTTSGKLIKNGTGSLALSGSSTGWNGEIVLNTGTLGIGGSNSLGGSSNTATFTINGGNLSNTGTGGRTVPAAITASLNADFSVDDSLFGPNPGQIAFNGPATIKNSDRIITVNGAANLGLADVREDTPSRSITKNGNGTLAFTGTVSNNPNVFTGSVTVNAGRLQVSGSSLIGNEANQIILNGGALNTSATRTVNLANPIQLTADSAITTTSTASTPNFDFSSNNPVTFTGAQTLTLRNDGGDQSTDQLRIRFLGGGFEISNPIDMPNGSTNSTVEFTSFNTNLQAPQTYSGVISGTGDFKRSVSSGTGGTTVMNAQNTFTGGTQLNEGTIGLAVDSVGPVDAPTSGPLGTGVITLGLTNGAPKLSAFGGNRVLANTIVFGSGSNLGITGDNDLTLSGSVSLANASRTIQTDGNGSTIMSGVISGTNDAGLTKTGAGNLTLSGTNVYTGPTTFNAGTVFVGSTDNLGDGSVNNNLVFNGGTLSHTAGISTNRSVTVNAGGGTIDTQANNSTINGTITGPGTLSKAGAGTLVVSTLNPGGLAVNGGTVKVATGSPNPATAVVLTSAPTFGATGRLDITNNKMVLNYTGATPVASVRQAIINGRGATDGYDNGETWNGTSGIISSTAASNVFAFGVGYAEVSDMPFSGYTSFGGQTVGTSSIIIKYTRNGDTDLNGTVDDTDVGAIVTYYKKTQAATAQWAYGDMDYDGQVDDDDVTAMATFYNPNATPVSPAQLQAMYGADFAAAWEKGRAIAASGAVPEPASLSILGLGGLAMLGRRRRKA